MSYKNILVHVDRSNTVAGRIAAALKLAQAQGAKLTGLSVVEQPYIPGYAEVEIGAEVIALRQESLNAAADEAGAAFAKQAEAAGVEATWKRVEGHPVEVLGDHSRSHDLLVVSQFDDTADVLPGGHEMPDRVILSAGRPVLVVPYIYKDAEIGKRVLVAWDGSRMASRAVHDALPLLKTAEEVVIMVVMGADDDSEKQASGEDIARHLADHGANVVTDHLNSGDMNIGDVLLSRAADHSSDLIVLGAYGHARWRELVLGGVTQYMLESMPVPVLMSH